MDPNRCNRCFVLFQSKYHYQRHNTRKVICTETTICPECNEDFKFKSVLIRHLSGRSACNNKKFETYEDDEGNITYGCFYCKKKFAYLSNVHRHVRSCKMNINRLQLNTSSKDANSRDKKISNPRDTNPRDINPRDMVRKVRNFVNECVISNTAIKYKDKVRMIHTIKKTFEFNFKMTEGVSIRPFGHEYVIFISGVDIKIFMEEFVNFEKFVIQSAKMIYGNSLYPENYNIYMEDKHDMQVMVYGSNGWYLEYFDIIKRKVYDTIQKIFMKKNDKLDSKASKTQAKCDKYFKSNRQEVFRIIDIKLRKAMVKWKSFYSKEERNLRIISIKQKAQREATTRQTTFRKSSTKSDTDEESNTTTFRKSSAKTDTDEESNTTTFRKSSAKADTIEESNTTTFRKSSAKADTIEESNTTTFRKSSAKADTIEESNTSEELQNDQMSDGTASSDEVEENSDSTNISIDKPVPKKTTSKKKIPSIDAAPKRAKVMFIPIGTQSNTVDELSSIDADAQSNTVDEFSSIDAQSIDADAQSIDADPLLEELDESMNSEELREFNKSCEEQRLLLLQKKDDPPSEEEDS